MFSKNRNSKDGLKNYCKQCASKYGKKYNQKHHEEILLRKKKWYEQTKARKEERTKKELEKGFRICTTCKTKKDINEFYKRGNGGFYGECKECCLKKQKLYHSKNREKILIKKHLYYISVKDHAREYCKNYYIKNSEAIKERVKKWVKENRERARISSIKNYHTRRARKKNLISNFKKSDWEKCKDYFRNRYGVLECAYCGKELKKATQDHFIPVSKGGHYTRNNIVPVCKSCNSSKCDKDFEEWYKGKEFYSEIRLQKVYEYLNSQN